MQQYPDNKVHGTNQGPIWGRQDLSGPHVGPMNFAIWVANNLLKGNRVTPVLFFKTYMGVRLIEWSRIVGYFMLTHTWYNKYQICISIM